MSTVECTKCKRHVSIYYINNDNLCCDCASGSLEFLKRDLKFDILKTIPPDPYKKAIKEIKNGRV